MAMSPVSNEAISRTNAPFIVSATEIHHLRIWTSLRVLEMPLE